MLNLILIQPKDAACNSVFSHSHATDETVLPTLREAHRLFELLDASPALTFRRKQINELNACSNSVIWRIPMYQRSQSVIPVVHGWPWVVICYYYCKILSTTVLKNWSITWRFWVHLITDSNDSCTLYSCRYIAKVFTKVRQRFWIFEGSIFCCLLYFSKMQTFDQKAELT